jgi:hypothetical protein
VYHGFANIHHPHDYLTPVYKCHTTVPLDEKKTVFLAKQCWNVGKRETHLLILLDFRYWLLVLFVVVVVVDDAVFMLSELILEVTYIV